MAVRQHRIALPFQSTPPRRGRPPLWYITFAPQHFNPRPRAGGDTSVQHQHSSHADFNPRPRAGGDPRRSGARRCQNISIHAPAQGATKAGGDEDWSAIFQSTPPRRGRLQTAERCVSRPTDFNPRPRAGGDGRFRIRRCGDRYFNPRPRAGGDTNEVFAHSVDEISIHAPAQGATFSVSEMLSMFAYFNPRPRAGGDRRLLPLWPSKSHFNPRPRAGGDSGRRADD